MSDSKKPLLECSSLCSWEGCCWAPQCGKRPSQLARIVQEYLQQALHVRGRCAPQRLESQSSYMKSSQLSSSLHLSPRARCRRKPGARAAGILFA
jgi:hypothetical protein